MEPISLLPVPSKICEKIAHIHIVSRLDRLDFLGDYQFGYRQGRGTGDAIFQYLNDLYDNRERGHITASCYVDLKKAFDSVDYGYLLSTVKGLGLDLKVEIWIET